MKIGLVLADIPGYSETFFRNKVKFLQETQEIEVTLLADRKTSETNWTLCEVIYAKQPKGRWGNLAMGYWLLRSFVLYPQHTWKLISLNRQSGFSARHNIRSVIRSIHILPLQVDWLHFGFGTMALGRENVARVINARMAVSFRGFDIAIYPLKNPRCYDLLWKRVDKVHVISNDLADLILNQGYPTSKSLIKITPAIDTKHFVSNKLTTSFSKPVKMITVSRLHWKKGLEYTLEALSIIKQQGVDFHYSIIGEGDEKERLVFATHQLGLKEQVTFTGKLNQAEVISLLQQSDVYIQYSIQEGFCNAVLEAQAMGLACIVSDAEGLSENIVHEQTGWVVPRRKPAMLASCLMGVLSMESQKLQKVCEQSNRRVHELFNLALQKDAFMNFYLR